MLRIRTQWCQCRCSRSGELVSTPILTTKLYIPPPRPNAVLRPALIERLNEGLYRKLTLISAPAGFGKTTLVSEWVAGCERPVAWLSLDEGDSDPTRFLTYLVAALQTIAPNDWSRGVGCAPIPAATANRIDSDGPAQ